MSNEETVRRYFACLDAEDWTTMRTLWTEDATLRAVGARPRSGIAEVIGYFDGLFSPWPSHTDVPTRLIADGDVTVAEVTFAGTTADGREVSFDAVDVFDLRAGRICRLSNWYDLAHVRGVLSGRR